MATAPNGDLMGRSYTYAGLHDRSKVHVWNQRGSFMRSLCGLVRTQGHLQRPFERHPTCGNCIDTIAWVLHETNGD